MRRKKQKGQNRDKAVLWTIRGLLRFQARWTDWMERKTQNVSPRTWAVLLAGFVVVSAGFNAWLIWYNLTGKDRQEISVTPPEKDRYITGPGDKVQDSLLRDSLLLKEE